MAVINGKEIIRVIEEKDYCKPFNYQLLNYLLVDSLRQDKD